MPGGIRTPNLLIRSQMLYPVELQTQQKRDFKITGLDFRRNETELKTRSEFVVRQQGPKNAVVHSLLESVDMNSTVDLFGQSTLRGLPLTFWERIINDEDLRGCSDLEKLLAGCEIIAALDARDLLAA